MKHYQEFLKSHPNGVITAIANNRPYSRVFQLLWTEGNRAFFCTANNKEVYRALVASPDVSFCTWNPETFEVVTINGKTAFVDDRTKKQRILDDNPMIADIYKTAENPVLELFYLEIETVYSFDFENGPHTQKLA